MGFTRNVPGWERAARALLGIALIAAAGLVPLAGWLLWAAIAGGAALVVTALAGFCPACAMIGWRL
jgi:cytochrome b561